MQQIPSRLKAAGLVLPQVIRPPAGAPLRG